MGLFSNFFGSKKSPIDQIIEKHIAAGCEWMLFESGQGKGAYFEAAIISTLFLLKHANSGGNSIKYKILEKSAFAYLVGIGNSVSSKLTLGVSDFINHRFKQYSDEIESVIDDRNIIPIKTLYNLFKTPLQPSSGELFDPMLHLMFFKGFSEYMKFTSEMIPIMFKAIE